MLYCSAGNILVTCLFGEVFLVPEMLQSQPEFGVGDLKTL
jgi:hypothetical protein